MSSVGLPAFDMVAIVACRDSTGIEAVVAIKLKEWHRCGVRSLENIFIIFIAEPFGPGALWSGNGCFSF